MVDVRRYQGRDKNILARLFTDTVHAISAADYSPEQVEAWAGDPPDLECWLDQVAGRIVLVAEHASEIVGFTTFEPNGHLNHLYGYMDIIAFRDGERLLHYFDKSKWRQPHVVYAAFSPRPASPPVRSSSISDFG